MQLDIFRRILFLDLRPSLIEKYSLTKVRSLMLEMEEVTYKHQPMFEVEIERVINVTHEYYQRLIRNTGIAFLNEFRNELHSVKTNQERQYITGSALKQLSYYLLQTYTRNTMSSSSITESLMRPVLKNELVRLYVEVSCEQDTELNIDFIDEVYHRFFNDEVPNPPVIRKATVKVIVHEANLTMATQPASDFQLHFSDFRPEAKGILSYDTIIKDQKSFAEFEEHLFLYGFIDEEYNFTNKHGLKSQLAQKYHELIKEGCFMPRDFERLKDIKNRDIRKFLDYRYRVNLDKQFRSY